MRLLVRHRLLGGHVHTDWWMGPNMLAPNSKCGTLVFTEDEWPVLRRLLEREQAEPTLLVEFEEK